MGVHVSDTGIYVLPFISGKIRQVLLNSLTKILEKVTFEVNMSPTPQSEPKKKMTDILLFRLYQFFLDIYEEIEKEIEN
jgi:hypothetical protein